MHDVIRAGPELRAHSTNTWLIATEIKKPLVVFVHGFTGHGRYLVEQAEYVERHGYCAAYFNYDSYRGIDIAASELAERLQKCGAPICTHGLILIGHSMGGLVVRECANFALADLTPYLRGVVLLGTPNAGTLSGRLILPRLLDWGDAISGINPYRRLPTCRAAKQLTLSDSEKLLEKLNQTERDKPPVFPTLTVSGGLAWLEFGEKPRTMRNWVANHAIQRALNEKPNDGLVIERSVDLRTALEPATNRIHVNQYLGYANTNHTSLTKNQAIGDVIIAFLKKITR